MTITTDERKDALEFIASRLREAATGIAPSYGAVHLEWDEERFVIEARYWFRLMQHEWAKRF